MNVHKIMNYLSFKPLFLTICFFILLKTNGIGQTVGLVLSGGGAKGMAHIGVIRALEENGIPIDYISGSSIGAMVGGLYASGYTTEEIEMIFTSHRFRQWQSGKVDPEFYYSYRNKNSAEMLSIRFRADSTETKAYLPASIVSPHQMDFAFMQILSAPAAAADYNFDNLYIPFRCMATDIYERKAVNFSKGNLASAVRASMTFPLYFKPIEIDGRLMFDGGIYDNFPKTVMQKDFKPDIIIGVKVASNFGMPDKHDIISQIENLIAGHTDYSLSEEEGILIDIDLQGVKLMDFELTPQTQQQGYEAAYEVMDEIKQRIQRRISPYQRNRERLAFRAKYPKLIFDEIIVEGLNSRQEKYIRSLVGSKNQRIDINEFKEQYNKLVASEHIDYMYPIAVKEAGKDFFTLRLPVEEAKQFRAGIGGNFSLTDMNQAYLGGSYRTFGARAYRFNANLYIGSFYNSAEISSRVYFPVQSQLFVDYTLNFSRLNFTNGKVDNFFEDKQAPYIIKNKIYTGLLGGMPISNNGYAFLGINIAGDMNQYYQRTNFRSDDTADRSRIAYQVYFGGYNYNTLNYINFPDNGQQFRARINYIQGTETHSPGTTAIVEETGVYSFNYLMLRSDFERYYKINSYLTLGIDAALTLSNKPVMSNYTSTLADAPVYAPTPYAYSLFNEKYRAHNYTATGIKGIFHISNFLSFRLEAQLFQPYQKISPRVVDDVIVAVYEEQFEHRYLSGRAALVYQSMVGPIYLSYNYFQNFTHDFYLSFGLGYSVFNNNSKMVY